jgi:L-threonylcarbamoyladenylate synthase
MGEDGSVAFRIPTDDFCLHLVERFGKPIVATSARIEGAPHPGNFGEISSDIIQGVDWVARYRRQEKKKHLPSVVARLGEKEELEFLRN